MCYRTVGRGFSSKNGGDLQILVEGDRRLFNQYDVTLVNPAKHPDVKKELGQQFIDWLISPDGQKAIANYKIEGEQSFYVTNTSPFFRRNSTDRLIGGASVSRYDVYSLVRRQKDFLR